MSSSLGILKIKITLEHFISQQHGGSAKKILCSVNFVRLPYTYYDAVMHEKG